MFYTWQISEKKDTVITEQQGRYFSLAMVEDRQEFLQLQRGEPKRENLSEKRIWQEVNAF